MSQEPVKKLSVLIVEDVDEMRELLVEFFSSFDRLSVIGAARGVVEARTVVHRHRPGLVFLDEVLPGESSLDFHEELKTLKIPVVFLTGISDRRAPLPEGALGRLSKPGWKGWARIRPEVDNMLCQILFP